MDIKWDEVVGLAERYDRRNLLGEYLLWGERFIKSLDNTPFITDDFRRLIIIGMGGSGIVGDVIRDCLTWDLGIPIDVVKYSKLPNYIDGEDLILGISFSGNTLETLSAVEEALKKNIRVIGITTGGKLMEISMKKKFPLILIEKSLAPRAGLPQLLGSALKAITSDKVLLKKFIGIGDILKEKGFEYRLVEKGNKAFKLAYHMWGRLPVFYASVKYHSLLHRAKSSINENAKINAYYTIFPEGFHNEIEAYEEPTDPVILPIIFKDDEMSFLVKYFDETSIEHLIIDLEGKDMLEKILTNILLVDVASIYLAYLRKKDPYEINAINKIKGYRS